MMETKLIKETLRIAANEKHNPAEVVLLRAAADRLDAMQTMLRAALHFIETPGHFSDQEVSDLMKDTEALAYDPSDHDAEAL